MRVHFLRGAVAGAATIVVVGLASGYTAWAQQPERRVTQIATPPKAAWTPMSGAPAGLLTALEGRHHDNFIERARAGDIDIVFFGMTETEMWHWPDRGRSVWDWTLGLRKAANFGSQGTRFESLLWRMQNGELAGYQAKLVVLQGFGPGDLAIPGDRVAEFVAGYTAIIAEVRARQPQAKILLSAAFPRGRLDREQWLENAEANAAVYRKLADERPSSIQYRRAIFPARRLLQCRDVVARPAKHRNTDTRLRSLGGRAAAMAGSVCALRSGLAQVFPQLTKHFQQLATRTRLFEGAIAAHHDGDPVLSAEGSHEERCEVVVLKRCPKPVPRAEQLG